MNNNKKKKDVTHFFPVPIRYVFVPCRVIGLGLHPKILTIRFERVLTFGINVVIISVTQLMKDKFNFEILYSI